VSKQFQNNHPPYYTHTRVRDAPWNWRRESTGGWGAWGQRWTRGKRTTKETNIAFSFIIFPPTATITLKIKVEVELGGPNILSLQLSAIALRVTNFSPREYCHYHAGNRLYYRKIIEAVGNFTGVSWYVITTLKRTRNSLTTWNIYLAIIRQ
jgi:hypothetical protein